jgi:hypothetical protein
MSKMSDEMKALLEHQKQLKNWLIEVNSKIYSMEESYLEETPLGNIVRGWEIDGKPLPLKKDEKERLFSSSSYQSWLDNKSSHEVVVEAVGEKRSHHATVGSHSKSLDGHKNKKSKKSSNGSRKDADEYEEWEQKGDY